jgi:hypothetical protein
MRTNFRDNSDGSHQLQPVLNKIDEAIAKSDANPCYTPGCQCDVLEDVQGNRFDSPNLAVCDGCKVHWLLETAACIARDAIARSKLS